MIRVQNFIHNNVHEEANKKEMESKMKNTKRKTIIALVLLLETSVVNAVTDRITGTADIVFKKPANPLTIQITPKAGLVEGVYDNEIEIADFTITSTNPTMLAVSFTKGIMNQDTNGISGYINGTRNSQKKIPIRLRSSEAHALATLDGWNWLGSADNVYTFSGKVYSGPENISADTYKLSLDAAVFSL